MCDSVDALLRDGYVVLGGCFARDAARELVLRLGCGVEYETLAACLEDEDLALGPFSSALHCTSLSRMHVLWCDEHLCIPVHLLPHPSLLSHCALRDEHAAS